MPSPKRNADASVQNLDPAPPQQTSSGHSAPPMPTGGLRYNLPRISYLQLYRAILQAVRSADYRPAWSKCATSAQDTAKDKVFVSHCRRRRKDVLPKRSAGFETCGIADIRVGRPWNCSAFARRRFGNLRHGRLGSPMPLGFASRQAPQNRATSLSRRDIR